MAWDIEILNSFWGENCSWKNVISLLPGSPQVFKRNREDLETGAEGWRRYVQI